MSGYQRGRKHGGGSDDVWFRRQEPQRWVVVYCAKIGIKPVLGITSLEGNCKLTYGEGSYESQHGHGDGGRRH